jgi:hypothetical protein
MHAQTLDPLNDVGRDLEKLTSSRNCFDPELRLELL